jgi:uncharacterized protein
MTILPIPRPPLTDAEIDALNALLEMRAVPFKGMSLEMLDGFLAALIVGPEPVPADVWMPMVWGAHPPRWESPAESDRVRDQLMALWVDVVRRVAVDPAEADALDQPLIAMPESEEALAPEDKPGIEWAVGFLDGVELRASAWQALIGSEQWIDESLWCIQAIAEGEWPVPEGTPSTGPISSDERLELIAGIPQMLFDLNTLRFDKLVSHIPIRKQAEPGRNDPCPCGSGRKYKKCCGAAATNH